MARRFTGFLWILFFVVVGATFYFGFVWGYNLGREETAAASEKAAGEAPIEAEEAVLQIGAGEDYFSYELRAGELLATVVRIENQGAVGLMNLSLELEAPEPFWSVTTIPAAVAELAPGAGEEIAVEIKPTAEIQPGQYKVILKVAGKSPSGAAAEARKTLTINVVE